MAWDQRYRVLNEGEIIQHGDEVQVDKPFGWEPATQIGQPAPCPYYTSHRVYRRVREGGKQMVDAPERIRVAQDADGFWTCREAVIGSQEYVRADLYAALEAKLAAERAAHAETKRERGQLLDKLHCMCGSPIDHSVWEGHTPVSVYDYSLDQERSRAEAAEAQLAEARKALGEIEQEARSLPLHTSAVTWEHVLTSKLAVVRDAARRALEGGADHG